jgi:formylglycine-generating enzyme required for sulfatase activity
VRTETVQRVAINYPFSKFLDIDSASFSGVWKGTIEVPDQDQTIDINFCLERAEASLKIDGASVTPFIKRSRTITYAFSKGRHDIQVNFINHWHTTGLNVSFTRTPSLTTSQARSRIAALAPSGATVYSASISESGNLFNEVKVGLDGPARPVFLVLSSVDAVHWVIDNSGKASIRGVFLDSQGPGSTVAGGGDIPIYRFPGLRFDTEDLTQRAAELLDLFGRPASQVIGEHSPKELRFLAANDKSPAAASAQARVHPSGMAAVPADTFTMGEPAKSGKDLVGSAHAVSLKGFSIGRTEVTQAEWEAAMGSNPCSFLSDFLPVNRVTWFDAIRYCNKRSEAEGLRPAYAENGDEVTCDWSANGYRLPTEAEWEYAARAGQAALYAGSGALGDVAWCSDNASGVVHTVGEKKPNDLGLYDMSGNVAEWCWDSWGDPSLQQGKDPRGPDAGSFRVVRGGGIHDSEAWLRVSARATSDPCLADVAVGFRVVRSEGAGGPPLLTRKAAPTGGTGQPASVSQDPAAPRGMVAVPGGIVTMGDTAGTGNREPTYSATVSGFFLSRTELTQAEYLQFCQETGANYPAWMEPGHAYNAKNVQDKYYDGLVGPGMDAWPILGVSWYDAVAYCNWRSLKEGLSPAYAVNGRIVNCDWKANGYRLPTETEWEYAAKAGRSGESLPYAGSARIEDVGWYRSNCEGATHPVAQKKPNGFGLFDMSGNAFEWCWDWYADDAGGAGSDPRGPDTGTQRVIRGGSFLGSFWTVLVSGRSEDYPGSTEYNVGFRLARGGSQ